MTWIRIANFYVNLNSISRIERVGANNFNVYFFDQSITGLSFSQVQPALDALGLVY